MCVSFSCIIAFLLGKPQCECVIINTCGEALHEQVDGGNYEPSSTFSALISNCNVGNMHTRTDPLPRRFLGRARRARLNALKNVHACLFFISFYATKILLSMKNRTALSARMQRPWLQGKTTDTASTIDRCHSSKCSLQHQHGRDDVSYAIISLPNKQKPRVPYASAQTTQR